MSLPSVEFLKDQATRLVTYLGDKHRFRLKPASALEAVAAMYGKHDWNTLAGLAGRADATAPSTGLSVSVPLSDSFPLTWTESGHAQLSVSRDDWYRHALAAGGTRADRQAWLQQHFNAHVARDGAGLFLNALGELPMWAREVLHSQGLLVDLVHENSTLSINLMADMDPADIAAMTTGLVFARDGGLTADYWKQSATRVLAAVARALREAGEQVTLARLAELFPQMSQPTKLHELMLSLAAGTDARKDLQGILAPHGAAGGAFSEKTWATHYSILSRALWQLSESSWTRGLFSSAPGALGLFSLLSQGKCLVIECPEPATRLPERAVLDAMRSALALRHQASRESREAVPWLLALGEVDGYLTTAAARMAEQGRSTRMALLMTTRDPGVLESHPTGRELLASVWNKLHLRGCSPAQPAGLMAKMDEQPVLVQPGRVTAAI